MSCKQQNNSYIHYDAIYAMLAVISMELANEEVVVDLIRVVLALQVGPVRKGGCDPCRGEGCVKPVVLILQGGVGVTCVVLALLLYFSHYLVTRRMHKLHLESS